MVQFGTKAGDDAADTIRKESSGGGGGQWFSRVRPGKDMRVRFLTEPKGWYKYYEHYSDATKYFPCTQDDSCPGCKSDNERLQRKSKRYVANVLDVKFNSVVMLKMPLTLANKMVTRYERNTTLLSRDFTLICTGQGLDVDYDVEQEDKTDVDVSKYTLLDPEPILQSMYAEAFGAEPADAAAAETARSEEERAPFDPAR